MHKASNCAENSGRCVSPSFAPAFVSGQSYVAVVAGGREGLAQVADEGAVAREGHLRFYY